MGEHWSDCAVHNAPALPIAACDCGGLNLADDRLHGSVATFVASSGGIRVQVNHLGREGFIEPHELPTNSLTTLTSALSLPNAHDIVVLPGDTHSVNFDDTRVALISQFKALALSKCFTGDTAPQSLSSLPESDTIPAGNQESTAFALPAMKTTS